MQQYFGIDLDHAMSGEHTAKHIMALTSQLPQESRIAAIGNSDNRWSLTDTLLAILINHFNLFIWGMSDKKSRGPKPELIGPSFITTQKRKLAARVLPIDELMAELSKPRR